MRSTLFNVKITTNHGKIQSVLPVLRSSLLFVNPTFAIEHDFFLGQMIESTRLVVANNLSVVNESLGKDTAQVSASPPPPIAELSLAERA